MYIKKIVLENFQAFEKGEFELSPNLNILVGVSNVGKSSVARALALVLFNQWDKSWVRFGAKFCRVTLETSTGVTVVREKGDKVNRYILRLPGQPEQIFDSFGTTTPEQIQQALKIHEVQIDTTDKLNLNLAGQMDALFLLSQTGSYRAKVLGKLSGATYLDQAIRELNGDKRKLTAEKNTEDLNIVKFQAQVDKYAQIESYTAAIDAFEARLSLLAISKARIERLRALLDRVKVYRDSWTRGQQKKNILDAIDLEVIKAIQPRVDKINAVRSLFNKVADFKPRYLKVTKRNEVLILIDLSVINRVISKELPLRQLTDLKTRVIKNKANLTIQMDELELIEPKLQETTRQYTEMLRENGVCPTCNQVTEHLCAQ